MVKIKAISNVKVMLSRNPGLKKIFFMLVVIFFFIVYVLVKVFSSATVKTDDPVSKSVGLKPKTVMANPGKLESNALNEKTSMSK